MSAHETITIPIEVFNQLASFVAQHPTVQLMETLMKLAAKHNEEVADDTTTPAS